MTFAARRSPTYSKQEEKKKGKNAWLMKLQQHVSHVIIAKVGDAMDKQEKSKKKKF